MKYRFGSEPNACLIGRKVITLLERKIAHSSTLSFVTRTPTRPPSVPPALCHHDRLSALELFEETVIAAIDRDYLEIAGPVSQRTLNCNRLAFYFMPNLFFISGSSSSGKSTVLPDLVRFMGDKMEVWDFDGLGVPTNADSKWRQKTTKTWLLKAWRLQRDV